MVIRHSYCFLTGTAHVGLHRTLKEVEKLGDEGRVVQIDRRLG